MTREQRENGPVNVRQGYKFYKAKAEHPPIPIDDYLIIVGLFIKFIMAKLLSGFTVKLPERFGQMHVRGRKVKAAVDEESGMIRGVSIDFKATKELWARCPECAERRDKVFHFNEHSNGVRYGLCWSKKDIYCENKSLFSFMLSRANKRAIARAVNSGVEFDIDYSIPFRNYNKSKTA